MNRIAASLSFLALLSSATARADALGVFSPSQYKTQYVYDVRTIAGDRLQSALTRRKPEIDGCAAVLNAEKGEYAYYYKVPNGLVAIELNLDQSGVVRETRVAEDTLPDPRIAECVHREAKRLRADVSGLTDFKLKKFLVLEVKCSSTQPSVSSSTVVTRCAGESRLYDQISR